MATDARDVLEILGVLEREGVDLWVEGGWGIDALIGVQNRDHGDLDVVIDATDADRFRAALIAAGWRPIFEDPPGRASFQDAKGRIVDVSITAADRYGDRWNVNRSTGRGEPDYPFDGFTYGWIGGEKVPCLGPETQVFHHLGYEIEDVDTFDMKLLRDRFDVALPESLR